MLGSGRGGRTIDQVAEAVEEVHLAGFERGAFGGIWKVLGERRRVGAREGVAAVVAV